MGEAGYLQLAAGFPVMDTQLQELAGTIDGKLAETDETIAVHKQGQGEAALAKVRSDVGKAPMDRARVTFDVLIEHADRRPISSKISIFWNYPDHRTGYYPTRVDLLSLEGSKPPFFPHWCG
ncbi:CHASE3 domain-containing protein [Rhizobium mongolense]